MSATVKQRLQQELFLPNDERLISMVPVFKVPRKRKSSYLCAVLNTSETQVSAHLYQVKKGDRGDVHKKKLSWLLRDLRQVDGKSAEKETTDFDLHFEKVYKWTAMKIEEKENFISSLWRLCQRFLIQKPEFINVPERLLEDVIDPRALNQKSQSVDDLSMAEEDYQALSSKEESDLEMLMSECKVAMSNAEVFTEQLSKHLSVLDGANIHSIVGSEDQVLNLMRLLDEGIKEAEQIEEKLNSYDQILANVKEQMEVMQDKDTLVTRRNTNHQRLLEHLQHLVVQLDLDLKHIQALMDGDLTTPEGIMECTAAAQALHRCMNANIHASMLKMAAVEEQQKQFKKFSVNFTRRLATHINNLFVQQGKEFGETLNRASGDLRMPQHGSSHRDLVVYAELMLWLKSTEPGAFEQLSANYVQSLRGIYSREVTEFLELAKQRLLSKEGKGKHNTLRPSGSSSSLSKMMEARGRSSSMQSVDSAHTYGSETDLAARNVFDQVLEKVLVELERVCIAEQDFCCRFFHLIDKTVQANPEPAHKDGEQEGSEDIWLPQGSMATERQINDEVRTMMGSLFPTLETELEAFLAHAEKQDGMYTMYMLVRMSQHVINNQHMGSFLGKTFGNCLIKVKRGFDKCTDNMIQGVKEVKVSKKNRCGIISFVHQFEDFTNLAEAIFKGSDRRTDLNKAYSKMVCALFEQIQRVAMEHQKTPREVVLMENFHRIFSILSHLKNAGLEGDRKEAKQRYTENMQAYTTNLLGRPLEKLHIFFEGVEARVAAGVARADVGFQLAFSKTELRKVIKEYPGKEVKKTLEHLYKKVEKQLCEEENLLQVVWHEMQDMFINQYKHYDDLMKKCYPDSQISLEFTIDNVLQYFSDIAQSH
ncbi:exocyst complex component 1-like isoform X2 [Babylonia areolata]|uniref:exocyst complex component 1-like isoform X2 n=1 Tax=Babylonia areolata TaxID=304850 RepID=UPI003FCF9464